MTPPIGGSRSSTSSWPYGSTFEGSNRNSAPTSVDIANVSGRRVDTNPKSWLDRLLGMAIIAAASAYLLRAAWVWLHPLLPIALGLVVGVGILKLVVGYQRRRW